MKQRMPMLLPTQRLACTAALLVPFVLAACTSGPSGFADPFASRPAQPAPQEPAPPPVAMDGRWRLAATDGAMCGMNFTSAPEGTSGKIAPEGGCPGRFFTSRQWRFEQGGLLILDHKEQPLAQLASTEPPGSFQGRARSGISVSLTR